MEQLNWFSRIYRRPKTVLVLSSTINWAQFLLIIITLALAVSSMPHYSECRVSDTSNNGGLTATMNRVVSVRYPTCGMWMTAVRGSDNNCLRKQAPIDPPSDNANNTNSTAVAPPPEEPAVCTCWVTTSSEQCILTLTRPRSIDALVVLVITTVLVFLAAIGITIVLSRFTMVASTKFQRLGENEFGIVEDENEEVVHSGRHSRADEL